MLGDVGDAAKGLAKLAVRLFGLGVLVLCLALAAALPSLQVGGRIVVGIVGLVFGVPPLLWPRASVEVLLESLIPA